MSHKNKNHGNQTRSEEMPHQPLPEITTPGVRENESQEGSGNEKSHEQSHNQLNPDNEVDLNDVEAMRHWDEQHKM